MSTYAVSDLHGRLDLYNEICKFLKTDDKVFFLGDAGDRGPQSWETIKAIANDSRFTYLKGNHEDMLVCAFGIDKRGNYGDAKFLLYHNGGEDTFRGLVTDADRDRWAKYIMSFPTSATFVNENNIKIHLSHAGFTPPMPSLSWDLLWDREHFFNPWPAGYDNDIVVHGHTPIPNLVMMLNQINHAIRGMPPVHWDGGACYYAGAHKIDIDCGTYDTGRCILLDLDTFDEHIFQGEGSLANV